MLCGRRSLAPTLVGKCLVRSVRDGTPLVPRYHSSVSVSTRLYTLLRGAHALRGCHLHGSGGSSHEMILHVREAQHAIPYRPGPMSPRRSSRPGATSHSQASLRQTTSTTTILQYLVRVPSQTATISRGTGADIRKQDRGHRNTRNYTTFRHTIRHNTKT